MRSIRVLVPAALLALAAVGCTGETGTAPLKESSGQEQPSQESGSESSGEAAATEEGDSGAQPLTGTADVGPRMTVKLSGIERGVSSEYAAPANTPYVKFTVALSNRSSEALDPTDLFVSCAYGPDGQTSESVFDEGVGDVPTVRIMPGKTSTFTQACELPKDVTELQIQAEDMIEGAAVVFQGEVK